MAEQSENLSDSQQQFKARLEEHIAKGRLARQKMPGMVSKIQGAFDSGQDARLVVRELINVGNLQTDTDWLDALVKGGIASDTILRVWETKDQNSRDRRDKSNPQAK